MPLDLEGLFNEEMPENLVARRLVETDEGPREVPVAYTCKCGLPAVYGKKMRWFCTTCWQETALWH